MLRRVWVSAVALLVGCGESNDYKVDDAAATAKIQEFYLRDPMTYWSQYGVPALVRSAGSVSEAGLDELAPFASLEPRFEADRFMMLVQDGALPADVVSDAMAIAGPAPSPWVVHLAMYVVLVDRLDLARLEGGYASTGATEALSILDQVFRAGFSEGSLAAIAPGGIKMNAREIAPPRTVCSPGADAFSDDAAASTAAADAGADDNNTTYTFPWREIMSGSMWKTSYNGACATVAVGACASKLGIAGFEPRVSCATWNDVSDEVRDTSSKSGGTIGGVTRFFENRGYCGKWARDGLGESACEEAAAALGRGCNVDLVYRDSGGGAGHIENVDLVTVDATNSSACIVHTLSWGMSAMVNVESGRFKGKSDAGRYGAGSYLGKAGPAQFLYFCPCEDR